MLQRLSAWCYDHRWIVLAIWVFAFFGTSAAASAAGDGWSQAFKLQGADSYEALKIIEERFPEQAGASGDVVFGSDLDYQDPAVRPRLEAVFADVAALPGVTEVVTPYDEGRGARLVAGPDAGDAAGRIGFAQIQFVDDFDAVPAETLAEMRTLADDASTDGLQVELGGDVFAEQGPPGTSELIGIFAAILILLVAFGSVLAMGLPIMTALFGLGIGVSLVSITAHVTSVPEFATQLAAMIGIGVGIDYALFIVTRYREGLSLGLEPRQAVVTSIDTAGRAVLFAGTTVVISLASMLLIGIEFVGGLGVSAALVVLVTMFTSITLLPAVLGFVGRTIDRFSLPGVKNRAAGDGRGFWYRWSRTLQRNPWPAALGGLAVLLLLAVPVLSMRLGFTDAGNRPEGDTTREAYDLKAQAFGPGSSAPLLVVATLPDGTEIQPLVEGMDGGPAIVPALAPLIEAVGADDGVAGVDPFVVVNPDGDVALLQVVPTTSGQDAATIDTLNRLRGDVIPAAVGDAGIEVHVGGITALFEDMSVQLQERLPVFIGAVLLLSFLLLMVVFRSILVPIKAVIMNLLSIGAAYGIIVAIFQWGWGADAIGIGRNGPIESFLPMMMFAILFGLSMDYEVFLLTRIKEEYDRTGDNGLAVADGLSATARVITAAALIMVTVFGSFIFGDERVIKMFGIGLAVAILIDATIVRMVLVPATMELLGDANWWFPKWLQWLPKVHVEGTAHSIETLHPEALDLTGFDSDADDAGEREPVGSGR